MSDYYDTFRKALDENPMLIKIPTKNGSKNAEDFIDRKELLDRILHRMEVNKVKKEFRENEGLAIAQGYIIGMQRVVPMRAEGEWIVKMDCEGKTRTCTCNLCGNETSQYTWVNPNFCSNCGASMKNRGEKY